MTAFFVFNQYHFEETNLLVFSPFYYLDPMETQKNKDWHHF
jgi:hypothetical protein